MALGAQIPQGLRNAGAPPRQAAPKRLASGYGAHRIAATNKVLGRPAGKPHQMPSQHKNATHHQMPKAQGNTGAGGQSFLTMDPQAYAQKVVGEETKAGLQPFQARGAELTQLEGTATNRYKGYGEATDKLIGGLQQGAEGSAKTFGNMAAESALRASNATGQVGQNTVNQNAGYLDPQVKAALSAQGANIGEIGAARTAGAEGQGQAESNYLTSLRAAAAQRVSEGQQGIASAYAKQQGQNQQGISNLLARVPGATSKLAADVAQKQFTDRATEQGLGIKLGGLKVDEQNAATKRFSAADTARRRAAETRQADAKLGFEREKFGSDQEFKKAKLGYEELNGASKRNYEKAAIKYKQWQASSGSKGASVAEANKWASEVGRVQTSANIGKERTPKAYQAARERLIKENPGINQETLNAGLNLAFYGHLVGNDEKNAFAHGLSPALKPKWFTGK